jgi:hypothetical protein
MPFSRITDSFLVGSVNLQAIDNHGEAEAGIGRGKASYLL